MEPVSSKYAILTKRSEIKLHLFAREFLNAKDSKERTFLESGTLLKVADHNKRRERDITVQVLDYFNKNPEWENNLYECPAANVKRVYEDLWPFVIAIPDPAERLRFTSNEDRWKHVLYLKKGDLVSVSGVPFHKPVGYDCIVRFIGIVQEIGPGYHFGLELLHLENGYSPQSNDIPFVVNYMSSEPHLSLIVPANWIERIENEVKKKFSPLDIVCGTLGKARTAIGFSNTTRQSSLRRKSSLKKKKHSPPLETGSPKSPTSSESNETATEVGHVGNIMDHRRTVSFTRDQSTNTSFAEKTASNGTAEKDQNDKSIKGDENLVCLTNDDYAEFVENYEKTLERKKKSTESGTIMSLDDRDIMVIDEMDIANATKTAGEVIVVNKPRQQKEVDLADLLGSNWPSNAGDAALVLNAEPSKGAAAGGGSSSNSSLSSFNARIDRNKSSNPISHLMNTKSLERRTKDSLGAEQSGKLDLTGRNKERKLKNTIEPIYDNANLNSNPIVSLASPEDEFIAPSPLPEIPGTDLGVGSVIEVSTDVCEDLYGVIRWIGCPQGSKTVMVGVELEDDPGDKPLNLTNGAHNGIRLFKCPNGRALFVHPNQCLIDRRFIDIDLANGGGASAHPVKFSDSKMFGQVECPSVSGSVPPLKIFNLTELDAICGKFKGIQGHHNSCYLDATLFAMFTFTSVFDSLLFRPSEPEDISHYEEVQSVLREEIVNPLRKNVFVRADRVMKLRHLLDRLSSVSGLTSEEKDPEEFLNSLLAQIMRADPFLKLSSGQDAFFYQLFVEKDERLSFPSVQQLFEQSFLASDIKLKEVPSCLIIQMPRFGKNFKMYPRILPSQVLDVTDIIEDSPRQCSVCGKLAEFECRECFGILQCGVGLESTAFCKKCLETVHSHAKRANHTPKEISVPQDFKIMAEHLTVPRVFMELFAVVCIETSHYVAFVKAGSGLDAPWCFFDSMADRKGEQNGYNIPEMISVPDLPQWLSEEGARSIHEAAANDKMLPEHAKRLLCDAYMCMYQSTDVMMYR